MSRPDGSNFWATGALMALRDDAGRVVGFGKILRNRTDLREQIETLRNRVEALETADQRKDVFLSTLAHELRNPLAPIGDAIRLIRAAGPATPEAEFPLRVIERQSESLRRLVDDLIDLARIGAGKIELRKELVRLQEILHRAVEGASPLLRKRQHHVELLLPRGPISIEGDRDRLVQVFVNLLNNAAKFTPEGGKVWVKATIEGDEGVVHIEDNGVGIPHDVLPRIFDLFTQADASRASSHGGLGIGLSVVKTLVSLHGGSVQVESDGPGAGSKFSVRLPLTSGRTPVPETVSQS
jgi:signal transduction histidine kinase